MTFTNYITPFSNRLCCSAFGYCGDGGPTIIRSCQREKKTTRTVGTNTRANYTTINQMRWGRRAKEAAGALNARQDAWLGDPASYSPGPPPGDLPRELAGESGVRRPASVFDGATAEIRLSAEVKGRFGDGFWTYGRDHGGRREGRRNFMESAKFVDPDDGSQRTWVRFNLEGPYGGAFVFAEVSKDMPAGKFVYILVQDKRNGAVITVLDNRSALLAKQMAGRSQEGQDVFSNLLGGGGGARGDHVREFIPYYNIICINSFLCKISE